MNDNNKNNNSKKLSKEITMRLMSSENSEEILEWILIILDINFMERTRDQLLILHKFFEFNQFFQKLSTTIDYEGMLLLCKYLTIQKNEKDQMVVREGQIFNSLLIIVEGVVGVYTNIVETDNQFLLTQKHNIQDRLIYVNQLTQLDQIGGENKAIPFTKTFICETQYYKKKKGQNCIINQIETKRATGTIRIPWVLEHVQEITQDSTRFPQTHKLQVQRICLPIGLNNIIHNYVIGDNHHQNNEIFIVQQGQFVLLSNKTLMVLDQVNLGFNAFKSQKQTYETQVAILTKGQIFGDDEAFQPQPRLFSVRGHSSESVALCISLPNLSQSVQATNEPALIDYMRSISEQKNTWRLFYQEKVQLALNGYKNFITSVPSIASIPLRQQETERVRSNTEHKLKDEILTEVGLDFNFPPIQLRRRSIGIPIKSPRKNHSMDTHLKLPNFSKELNLLIQRKEAQFERVKGGKECSYRNLVDIIMKPTRNKTLSTSNHENEQTYNTSALDNSTENSNGNDTWVNDSQRVTTRMGKEFITLQRVLNTGIFALRKSKQQNIQSSYIQFLKNRQTLQSDK